MAVPAVASRAVALATDAAAAKRSAALIAMVTVLGISDVL